MKIQILYHHLIYPIWGPLSLWFNIRLYGHRYTGDNWSSKLWKQTNYGKRKWKEMQSH